MSRALIFLFLTFHLLALMGCQSQLSQTVKPTQTPSQDSPGTIASLKAQYDAHPDDPHVIGELADTYFQAYETNGNSTYRDNAIEKYREYLQYSPQHVGAISALYSLYLRKRHASPTNDTQTHQIIKNLFNQYPVLKETSMAGPSLSYALWMISEPSRIKDINELTQLLKTAMKESPNAPAAYTALARVYDYQRHPLLSLSVLRLGHKHVPTSPGIMQELSNQLMDNNTAMECVPSKQNINEAIKMAKALTRLQPDNIEAHRTLAKAFMYAGHFDLRLFEARTIYKKQPDPDNKLSLAIALSDTGKNAQEAENLFSELLSQDPDNEEIKYELAQLYTVKQDWQSANKLWQQYLVHNKDDFYRQLTHSLIISKLDGQAAGKQHFRDQVEGIALTPWQKQLKDYRLDMLAPETLLEKAHTACEQTEAEFYIGLTDWLENHPEQAKTHFNRVLELNVPSFFEFLMASNMLKTM